MIEATKCIKNKIEVFVKTKIRIIGNFKTISLPSPEYYIKYTRKTN